MVRLGLLKNSKRLLSFGVVAVWRIDRKVIPFSTELSTGSKTVHRCMLDEWYGQKKVTESVLTAPSSFYLILVVQAAIAGIVGLIKRVGVTTPAI